MTNHTQNKNSFSCENKNFIEYDLQNIYTYLIYDKRDKDILCK